MLIFSKDHCELNFIENWHHAKKTTITVAYCSLWQIVPVSEYKHKKVFQCLIRQEVVVGGDSVWDDGGGARGIGAGGGEFLFSGTTLSRSRCCMVKMHFRWHTFFPLVLFTYYFR